MEILRLFADETGETRLGSVELTPSANGGARTTEAFGPIPVMELHIRMMAREATTLDLHCAPRRQLVTLLEGQADIVTSDGTTSRFEPGALLLVEDVSGKGHAFVSITPHVLVAVLPVPDDWHV